MWLSASLLSLGALRTPSPHHLLESSKVCCSMLSYVLLSLSVISHALLYRWFCHAEIFSPTRPYPAILLRLSRIKIITSQNSSLKAPPADNIAQPWPLSEVNTPLLLSCNSDINSIMLTIVPRVAVAGETLPPAHGR